MGRSTYSIRCNYLSSKNLDMAEAAKFLICPTTVNMSNFLPLRYLSYFKQIPVLSYHDFLLLLFVASSRKPWASLWKAGHTSGTNVCNNCQNPSNGMDSKHRNAGRDTRLLREWYSIYIILLTVNMWEYVSKISKKTAPIVQVGMRSNESVIDSSLWKELVTNLNDFSHPLERIILLPNYFR